MQLLAYPRVRSRKDGSRKPVSIITRPSMAAIMQPFVISLLAEDFQSDFTPVYRDSP